MGEELVTTQIAWQAEFQRILAMRKDRPSYDRAFLALLDNPEYARTEGLQQKLDRNEHAMIQLYLKLDQSLTEDQHRHMLKKLRDYAEDFRTLAKQ